MPPASVCKPLRGGESFFHSSAASIPFFILYDSHSLKKLVVPLSCLFFRINKLTRCFMVMDPAPTRPSEEEEERFLAFLFPLFLFPPSPLIARRSVLRFARHELQMRNRDFPHLPARARCPPARCPPARSLAYYSGFFLARKEMRMRARARH